MKKKKIGELLKEAHLIRDEDLKKALEAQKETGERLGSTLVRLKLVDGEILSRILAEQQKVEGIDLEKVTPEPEALALLTRPQVQELGCLPISLQGDTLKVAMMDPRDPHLIKKLESLTGKTIEPAIAPQSALFKTIQFYYPPWDPAIRRRLERIVRVLQDLLKELNELLNQ